MSRTATFGTCRVRGCGRDAVNRIEMLCNAHKLRLYRYGSVFASRPVGGPRGLGTERGAKAMKRNGARGWYENTRSAPRGFAVQPLQAFIAVVVGVVLLVAARPSPGGAAAAPGIGPGAVRSVAGADAARSVPATDLLSELDLAARRIEALEAHRALAGECVAVCPLGVESVEVRRDRASCRCRRVQSLGVWRFER